MKNFHWKYVWRLIGGVIFVIGANYASKHIGNIETYAIIAIVAGLLLAGDVGIPRGWKD